MTASQNILYCSSTCQVCVAIDKSYATYIHPVTLQEQDWRRHKKYCKFSLYNRVSTFVGRTKGMTHLAFAEKVRPRMYGSCDSIVVERMSTKMKLYYTKTDDVEILQTSGQVDCNISQFPVETYGQASYFAHLYASIS